MSVPQKHVDIVFDGAPSPESCLFVEVEDATGKSISIGRWVHREDGHWVLRITAETMVPIEPAQRRTLFVDGHGDVHEIETEPPK